MNKEKRMLLHLLMEKYGCLLGDEEDVCCPDTPPPTEDTWSEWEQFDPDNEVPPVPGSLRSIASVISWTPGVANIRYRGDNTDKIQFEITGGLPLDIADSLYGANTSGWKTVGNTTVQTSYGPSVSFDYIPVEGE